MPSAVVDVVQLSRPSVTLEMAKDIIKPSSVFASGSQSFYFFVAQTLCQNSNGNNPNRGWKLLHRNHARASVSPQPVASVTKQYNLVAAKLAHHNAVHWPRGMGGQCRLMDLTGYGAGRRTAFAL